MVDRIDHKLQNSQTKACNLAPEQPRKHYRSFQFTVGERTLLSYFSVQMSPDKKVYSATIQHPQPPLRKCIYEMHAASSDGARVETNVCA